MTATLPEKTFGQIVHEPDAPDFIDLNAKLNLYDEHGRLQLDADRQAVREYFLQFINPNTVFFHNLREKLDYLVAHGYYDPTLLDSYEFSDIKDLFREAYDHRHRFPSFIGALKFYTQYALKTTDGTRFLERYEDRVCMTALYLGQGDIDAARKVMTEIISGRFQPATPTFLNAGLHNRGGKVSCFLLHASDSMESITKIVSHSLQLSKNGGGVGINLTNLRESGAAIKGVAGAASGVVPVMKILEDCFSYANQLGARQGAGAVYLSCHHPDIMSALDTKRENADEKVRIKTLSIGVVITDVAFRLARENKDMYLFSPADVMAVTGQEMTSQSITENYHDWVEDPRIRKSKIGARQFFQTIAELQFESGYPYLVFEDTVNEHHHIDGRVSFSNLCSEIAQVSTPSRFDEAGDYEVVGRDISCNLGSLNVAKAVRTGNLADTVDTSIRALTQVSDLSDVKIVPTVRNGNAKSHAIGLGAMNLHGFLGSERIHYGSDEALDFVNAFFGAVRFHALSTSADIAAERGETFFEYELSGYAPDADGHVPALANYTSGVWPTTPQTDRIAAMADEYGLTFPTVSDWKDLEARIAAHGLYHAYLMAVAPTGSISYCTHSTSSIHPVPSLIEIRKEGKMGRVYSAAPGMTTETIPYFTDAYTLGPKAVIDTYAVAQKHVDQAQSLTLFFPDTATTRDLNKAYVYAFSRGKEVNEFGEPALYDPRTSWKTGFIKSLYYTRMRQQALSGSEVADCVSCTI